MRKTKVYNKLVRDLIPAVIENNGSVPVVRILKSDGEFLDSLQKKLKEEVRELVSAQGRKEVVSETADIMEVLHALLDFKNIPLSEVESARKKKRKERGGFQDRIFLIKTREK